MSSKGKKGNNSPATKKEEAPKAEAPKAEAPKVEAVKKEEAPKESPKKEAAPKKETPKKEAAPKAEAPKAEAPKVEAVKKEEAPKESPKKEAAPKGGKKGGKKEEAPKETPKAEEPKVEEAPKESPKKEAAPKGGKKGGKKEEPKVEEPKVEPPKEEKKASVAEEESDEEEVPGLTEAAEVVGEGAADEESKQSRHEKKARKAFQKLGLKAVDGVRKVTIKKSDKVLFVVNKPEVHKSTNSDTYVVYGEVKMEDMTNSALSNAAKQFEKPADAAEPTAEGQTETQEEEEEVPELVAAPETSSKKNSGFSAEDIASVKNQANVDEATAVKALEDAKGDALKAIMSLNQSTKKDKKQKKKNE